MSTMSSRLGSLSLTFLSKVLFGESFRALDQSQFGAFEALIQRAVQRRHLGELDDRLLQDIGVSKAEAYRESKKPLWFK